MRPHFGILDAEFLLTKRKKRTYQRASLLKRFLNILIDYMAILHFSIFVGVLLGTIFVLIGKNEWVEIFRKGYVNIAISWIVIFLYYFIGENFLKGRTLGKFATKTRVRNVSGEEPSTNDILIRSLTRLIPLEPLTIFLGEQQNESWHDALSETMVVED